jgi:hypothetical protein
MKAAALLLALSLTGCAGTAVYDVHPYVDAPTGQVLCCEARVLSRRDIGNVNVHVSKVGNDYVIDFSESAVVATAPIAAESATVSAVAGAVTQTAISAAQILK